MTSTPALPPSGPDLPDDDAPAQAAAAIRDAAPGLRPRVGLILGSGLGDLAARIEQPVAIPYGELPGFSEPGVSGHAGRLVLGRLAGVPVACMQGRVHFYEGRPRAAVTTPIRALWRAGCEILLPTCAAGSLRPEVGPGRLMALTDHINMLGDSPLVGPDDESYGPRFPSLIDAWDPELRAGLTAAAARAGIDLAEGVYASWLGPAFETPAEV